MSRESKGVTSVSDSEVTVDKTSVTDEFPVPTIKFAIGPTRDEVTQIRVTSRIPKPSPVESVGFHPDFRSGNWTAYKDHRVECEQTLDPDEEPVTVYGIRIADDRGQTDSLEEPALEHVLVDDGIDPDDTDDVLGENRSQVTRDALASNRNPPRDGSDTDDADPEDGGEVVLDVPADPDPEVEAADAAKTDATAADTVDAAGDEPSDDDLVAAFAGGDDGEIDSEAVEAQAADDGDESIFTPSPDDDVLDDDGEADGESAEPVGPHVVTTNTASAVTAHLEQPDVDVETEAANADVKTDADTGTTGGAPAPDANGLVGTFAVEIRSGTTDEDDLEAIREAVDAETRRSTDVRIRRLQSQMEDIAAHSGTLAEPIDGEGIGSDLVSELRAEMTASREDLGALDSMVDGVVESVDDVTSRLDVIEKTIAATDDRPDRIATQVVDAESHLDDHNGRLESLMSDLDIAEDTLDDYRDWLRSHSEQFETVEGRLGDHDERPEAASRSIDAGFNHPDSVEETLAKREEELVTIRERFDDITGRLDEIVNQLEGAESSTAEATERASTLRDEVGDIRKDIADLGGDIVGTRGALDDRLVEIQSRIEDAATDEEIEALCDDICELDDTVVEPETFREYLAGISGTGMDDGPTAGDSGDTDGAK